MPTMYVSGFFASAAAGSSDFQIERQENRVFVKPMRPGVSTDLFVWTASRRFVYELETQEVKNMNFAIDNPAPPAPHDPPPATPSLSGGERREANESRLREGAGPRAGANATTPGWAGAGRGCGTGLRGRAGG